LGEWRVDRVIFENCGSSLYQASVKFERVIGDGFSPNLR
jgi:hypothetical protein